MMWLEKKEWEELAEQVAALKKHVDPDFLIATQKHHEAYNEGLDDAVGVLRKHERPESGESTLSEDAVKALAWLDEQAGTGLDMSPGNPHAKVAAEIIRSLLRRGEPGQVVQPKPDWHHVTTPAGYEITVWNYNGFAAEDGCRVEYEGAFYLIDILGSVWETDHNFTDPVPNEWPIPIASLHDLDSLIVNRKKA